MTDPERLRWVATDPVDERAAFTEDVRAGLTAAPKRLACRYFYDAEGSRLFEEICALPEYYLTRAEREILARRAGEIAALFPPGAALVELGSGSAEKTRLLIEAFLREQGRLRYVPLDISRAALEESSRALLRDYPELEILAVAAEYGEGMRHLDDAGRPRLVLLLGSNVGNLGRREAAAFLRGIGEGLAPDERLLVGIDLRKPAAVLEPAYDDARGVTARFNLNLLRRINRELGGEFDLAAFRHRAAYNEAEGRVELSLVSEREQRVAIRALGLEVAFAAGEAVHTENSHKYSLAEIEALAQAAGLRVERQWFDERRRFSVNLLAP